MKTKEPLVQVEIGIFCDFEGGPVADFTRRYQVAGLVCVFAFVRLVLLPLIVRRFVCRRTFRVLRILTLVKVYLERLYVCACVYVCVCACASVCAREHMHKYMRPHEIGMC